MAQVLGTQSFKGAHQAEYVVELSRGSESGMKLMGDHEINKYSVLNGITKSLKEVITTHR